MDAGAFAPITAVGLYTVDLGGLKEELRFRYEIAGASPECAVHLFVPAPSWRPE